MEKPIGIRLSEDILRQIDRLGKKEMLDRSTIIRKLVAMGYAEFIRNKAAESYIEGEITLSEAASRAGLTLWEMEKYLVARCYKSEYSLDDLKRETELLK